VFNWAYAAGAGGAADASPMWTFVVPMVFMVVIFYFMLIRPQQKKSKDHRQLLENLKRGDRVITNGGLIGTIVNIEDHLVIIEVADKVRVEVGRPYIAGFAPKKGSKGGD
jgi:preprotein translocase subunit YajC